MYKSPIRNIKLLTEDHGGFHWPFFTDWYHQMVHDRMCEMVPPPLCEILYQAWLDAGAPGNVEDFAEKWYQDFYDNNPLLQPFMPVPPEQKPPIEGPLLPKMPPNSNPGLFPSTM